ncbi:hypothetical protein SLEP1_g49034 [Rubroshorea leprosula]|uniref:DUF8204 domain-containing protein n=1 Tax=Rubroshorea leprosula TaxID=152421 RepID=A0AAV5LYP1_9ROSI|nr:hypothetical protein SLEP1_g49034 [Rubroshorea leprosula]
METFGGEKRGEGKQKGRETKGGPKGRSCKGYLYYYSSTLKSNNRKPRCIGIPRSLPHENETSKERRALVDFYYACAGHSVYAIRTEASDDKAATMTQMPACVGLELTVDRRASSTDSASTPAPTPASVPANAHNRQDCKNCPPQSHKPAQPVGSDFLSRFTRNANLVASGVARNIRVRKREGGCFSHRVTFLDDRAESALFI